MCFFWNFCPLNYISVTDAYPLPRVEEALSHKSKTKYFTILPLFIGLDHRKELNEQIDVCLAVGTTRKDLQQV